MGGLAGKRGGFKICKDSRPIFCGQRTTRKCKRPQTQPGHGDPCRLSGGGGGVSIRSVIILQ